MFVPGTIAHDAAGNADLLADDVEVRRSPVDGRSTVDADRRALLAADLGATSSGRQAGRRLAVDLDDLVAGAHARAAAPGRR